eukprot:gene10444-12351_t
MGERVMTERAVHRLLAEDKLQDLAKQKKSFFYYLWSNFVPTAPVFDPARHRWGFSSGTYLSYPLHADEPGKTKGIQDQLVVE